MESLNTTTIYGDLLNTTTYDFILNNDSEISFNSVVCSPEPIAVNATELTGLGKFNEAYAGVHGYLSVMVCLFGMVANSVNIVVLTRKNMLSSTNVLLTWLAVADLFTMLSYFPFALHFFHLQRTGFVLFYDEVLWMDLFPTFSRQFQHCLPHRGHLDNNSPRHFPISLYMVSDKGSDILFSSTS